ncbi:cytochrome P450 [Occultella gossypii]|uniref:Cytochrome P450 n=1 Tax=Occultella gossypii TaxID=2800820 RepID=A0ABS7SGP8_9MICO|nr:cytochrome P450 [Occultella gossypii]MBZ2199530.1 cytochrome P450 [Occultella gossypii]
MTDCPFHSPAALPGDSTPTSPSPRFAQWREAGAAAPLRYEDGHEGFVITRHEEARSVLSDPRFTVAHHRSPLRESALVDGVAPGPLDDRGRQAVASTSLLSMDGPQHLRLRRAITRRLSVKAVRTRTAEIEDVVDSVLDEMLAHGAPANLTAHLAQPISVRVHGLALGVPPHLMAEFTRCFVQGAPAQDRHDLLRLALEHRRQEPGDDVFSDLVANPGLDRIEVEGLAFVLSTSGRDTVAYVIATAVVALLTDRAQYEALVADPDLVPTAVEELLRFTPMFLTLFPRTSLQDVQVGDQLVAEGTTVSVSPVGANRDPRRWDDPDALDVSRSARGHLSFGDGPHMCAGQQLARVEIAATVRTLVTRLPGLRLVDAEQLRPGPLANPVATYESGVVTVAW